MNNRIKTQLLLMCLALAGLLNGCSSMKPISEATYMPVSVYRDEAKNVLTYSGTDDVQHSIFRPQFLDYLETIYVEKGAIDEDRLRQAIATWNAVMPYGNTKIEFRSSDYNRLAGLSANNSTCHGLQDCLITSDDIVVLRQWQQFQSAFKPSSAADHSVTVTDDAATSEFLAVENKELRSILLLINNDPLGNRLVRHCAHNGVSIRVEKLAGKHAYYLQSRKLIVIDPKILNYEFNMRYLIHEMVHAVNQRKDNSISEEVLAELIGLDIQNRVTGIPMHLDPYAVFVQHLLHPEYGHLPVNNNIRDSLLEAGLI